MILTSARYFKAFSSIKQLEKFNSFSVNRFGKNAFKFFIVPFMESVVNNNVVIMHHLNAWMSQGIYIENSSKFVKCFALCTPFEILNEKQSSRIYS